MSASRLVSLGGCFLDVVIRDGLSWYTDVLTQAGLFPRAWVFAGCREAIRALARPDFWFLGGSKKKDHLLHSIRKGVHTLVL